jgi:23S rRNA (cytidine1920-2'-O)/16S rRNA (cytidine1409-2'-O)-methyltransferase
MVPHVSYTSELVHVKGNAPTKKKSSKRALVERLQADGHAPSVETAQKLILAGLVRVDGVVVDKVGAQIADSSRVDVSQRREYVGRGAYKLEGALQEFGISVSEAVCADVGACTGGFTEVLLRHGASKVYAIDVGYGNLDWKIRSDPRVVVMERTNARHLESLGEPISVVSIDVSFISLAKILPSVVKWLSDSAHIIALVKPQFEARRGEIGDGGIVTDPAVHDRVVREISDSLPHYGLTFRGVIPSPILGSEGNKEFLVWAEKTGN